MSDFGMYPSNNDTVKRWMAERENASARLDLARTQECCKLLLSQHDPVTSLGINRDALKVLLDFVQHHDVARLKRECEPHKQSKSPVRLWCETCDGTGEVYQEHQMGCHVGGHFKCPDCDGHGHITVERLTK
jgi:Zn finger protein HypA/HybF involved in hydrogenase expression